MSSDQQKKFLNDILGEIEKHKDIYESVELKSVIARRVELSTGLKWYNYTTIVKMVNSSMKNILRQNGICILDQEKIWNL